MRQGFEHLQIVPNRQVDYALSQPRRHTHQRLDITTLAKDCLFLICDHLNLPDISSLHRTCSALAFQGGLINSDKSSPITPTASTLIQFDLARGLNRAMFWAFIHKGDVDFVRHLLRRGYKIDDIESRLPQIRLRHPIIQCNCEVTHSCGFNNVEHEHVLHPTLVQHAVRNDHVELLGLLVEEQTPWDRFMQFDDRDEQITLFHLAISSDMIQALRQIDPGLPIDDQKTTTSEPLLT